ncbi:MAG: menaquinone biosynthesis protein [Chitinophagaceae bacterium]|nr:menaquinone biosynthesis protein [Chitinophagaceae bacterium]
MLQKIKVGAVSYLNTKPLIYGFEQGLMKDSVDLIFDYPSRIAEQLQQKQIDIGLIPVAAIPLISGGRILSDYCIGSEGDVASVCLFSDVPIEEIDTVLLDYQSRTSVALVQILLRKYWKIKPVFKSASEGYEKNISGKTAGVVIGDRAFEQRHRSAYHYDLAGAWKELTGLPFVFAAWVSAVDLSPEFEVDFNRANQLGLSNLDTVIAREGYDLYDLQRYFTVNISYRLDEEKKKGLQLFLQYLSNTVS